MKQKLALGMTVQTAQEYGGQWRVAYCVRCNWKSEPTSYRKAKEIACSEKSHICIITEVSEKK